MPRAVLTSAPVKSGRVALKPKVILEEAPELIDSSVSKITSGSYLLDLVIAGGWAKGRVVNVVGDRSAGKTLLAIEACANYDLEVNGDANAIRYGETEAAFDHGYASSIGMPRGVVFVDPPLRTVEDFYNDLNQYAAARIKAKSELGLYVLDSLDALSDEAEMGKEIDKGSFGASKAKKMSETFRRVNGLVEQSNTTLFIISQIRDKIGVMFGETKTRSGGRALDFYATQIVWLAEVGKIKRTVQGAERVVGVKVQVKCKKNKVGPAHRECLLYIYYNYGVDDEESMLQWLRENPKAGVGSAELDVMRSQLALARQEGDRRQARVISRNLRQYVGDHWRRIENALLPPMAKYKGRK